MGILMTKLICVFSSCRSYMYSFYNMLQYQICSHAQPYCYCPLLPVRVKYIFEWRGVSGLIWCPCLASEKKKGGRGGPREKNTKKGNAFFQENQALLLCKPCQMAYKDNTTSGHHIFLCKMTDQQFCSVRTVSGGAVFHTGTWNKKNETRDH